MTCMIGILSSVSRLFSPKLIAVPCTVSKSDMLSGHKTCLPQLFFEMGSLLLLQSLKRSVLDLTNEILHRLYPEQIAYCGLKLAGYYFLNALLPHAIYSTSYILAVLPHISDLIEPAHIAVELASYWKKNCPQIKHTPTVNFLFISSKNVMHTYSQYRLNWGYWMTWIQKMSFPNLCLSPSCFSSCSKSSLFP